MTKLNLNLENVKEEASGKYSKVPAGVYVVSIAEIEVKETAKKGHYLQMDLLITGGDHAGKLLVDRVNINVPGDENAKKAEEIGLGRLKKYAIATQAKNPNMIADTDELITGKMFKVETHLIKNTYEGKEVELTEVKKVLTDPTEGSAPSAPKTDSKPASGKKPWEK